jgi:hypothetical protein
MSATRWVLGASFAALGLAVTFANANADGYRRSVKDVGYERPFSWTGLYVGGQVG